MGSSCETEVSMDCVLTRLPTWVVACPATPVISDRTLVNPRLRFGRRHRGFGCLYRRLRLGLLLDFVVELALVRWRELPPAACRDSR